jgi:hypothetical protein
MLKRLPLLAFSAILVLCAQSPSLASPGDIGGPPVKAVSPPTTYSEIYSETVFADPFFYGTPRHVIIVPVIPGNSLTITAGDSRFESITPGSYWDNSGISEIYPRHHHQTGVTIGPIRSIWSTQPGILDQTPYALPHSARGQSLTNCQLILSSSHHRARGSANSLVCR